MNDTLGINRDFDFDPKGLPLAPNLTLDQSDFVMDNFRELELFQEQSGNHFGSDFCAGLGQEQLDDFALFPAGFITHIDSANLIYEESPLKAKIIADRYLLGALLGQGSYARVKECMDLITLRRAAVKIIKRRTLLKIPNGEQNVLREIALMRRLRHPNVCGLIEVVNNNEKEKLYVFLEYCICSLQDILDASPNHAIPSAQAHDYFSQLLDGLEYLHSLSIYHKDIKPGNLLLNAAGRLKITDFGVAESLPAYEPSEHMSVHQGTAAFQPPEVVANDAPDTFSGSKADIWAAALSLYTMVSGIIPFTGDTIFKVYSLIEKCKYEIPITFDSDLADLIRATLTPDPDRRLSISQIRNHPWYRSHQSILQPWRSVRYLRSIRPYESASDATEREATPTSKRKRKTPSKSKKTSVGSSSKTLSPNSVECNLNAKDSVISLTPSANSSTSSGSQEHITAPGLGQGPWSAAPSQVSYVNPNIGRLRYSNTGLLGSDMKLRQRLLRDGARALETLCNMSTLQLLERLHDPSSSLNAEQIEPLQAEQTPGDKTPVVIAEEENLQSLPIHATRSYSQHSPSKAAFIQVQNEGELTPNASTPLFRPSPHHQFSHSPNTFLEAVSMPNQISPNSVRSQSVSTPRANHVTPGPQVNGQNLHENGITVPATATAQQARFSVPGILLGEHVEYHESDQEHDHEPEHDHPIAGEHSDLDPTHSLSRSDTEATEDARLKRRADIERLLHQQHESSAQQRLFQAMQRKHEQNKELDRKQRSDSNKSPAGGTSSPGGGHSSTSVSLVNGMQVQVPNPTLAMADPDADEESEEEGTMLKFTVRPGMAPKEAEKPLDASLALITPLLAAPPSGAAHTSTQSNAILNRTPNQIPIPNSHSSATPLIQSERSSSSPRPQSETPSPVPYNSNNQQAHKDHDLVKQGGKTSSKDRDRNRDPEKHSCCTIT